MSNYQKRTKDELAARVAQDIHDGAYVNLGIGQPTAVANHIPKDREVILQSENGILGMGPAPAAGEEDYDLTNAGKQPVTLLAGGCYFHHADSFAMMRGGHLDICVLGAFQVAENGDLANWSTGEPGAIPAVGGAMDLAIGAKQTWVMMDLLTKKGESKIVQQCSYPLTGIGCVKRIYTDVATIEVTPQGLKLIDTVAGLDKPALEQMIGLRLLYGQIAFETAFFLLLITPEFFQPLRQAGTAFHSAMTAQTAEASLRRLLAPARTGEAGGDILQSAREARLAMGSAAGTRQADIPASQETAAAPTVLIRTLTYTYPHHPLPALAGRSLVLPAGTMTAVTGPSGCGKSTLLLTLAGLCAPYEGSVTIAGRELSSLPCAARTRLISYVPQEPHIFSGTLAENIALFAAPDAHRLADARRAAALDAAAGVPWEDSQQLGAGGAGLSEGQKKRLGLARAFYQDRPLVLLDEPTATLDRAAAARVRAALRQYLAGKTVLIATHDAALLALADHRIDWEVSP